MGKKPAAKVKSKAQAEPVVATPVEDEASIAEQAARRLIFAARRDAKKWVDAQLEIVRKLVEGAQACKLDWLIVAHEFHEKRLIKTSKRLGDKELESLPQELKDSVEAYVAQCAGSASDIQQNGFNKFCEAWDLLEVDGPTYVRAQESDEAAAAAEELKAWTDCSAEGVTKLTGLMQSHLASAGAQQAGFTRIGFLFSKAWEGSKEGLTAAALMPCITEAMTKHLADPDVQRYGCSALRGLGAAEGQLGLLCDAGGIELAVEGLKTHFKVTDVCGAANAAFWEMSQAAGKNSPEVTRMRTAGVTEVLLKVMSHHAWDQTLCGRVRLTLPFLKED